MKRTSFKLDRSQAKNGDTINLSIAAPPGLFYGIWFFKTVATFQGKEFAFPGAVSNRLNESTSLPDLGQPTLLLLVHSIKDPLNVKQ